MNWVDERFPVVLNLIGAPGAGKSTGAYYIASQLKLRGINTELVTEFAKDKTWEHNTAALSNQVYMLGKQFYKMSRCADQVDCIVTDSPLFLSVLYNNDPEILGETFNRLVMQVFGSFNNYTVFVNRVKKYNPAGRNQTEEESDELSVKLRGLCDKYGVSFEDINGCEEDYIKVANEICDIIEEIKEKKHIV